MKEKLDEIRAAASSAIAAAETEKEIEELRVRFLGKKGELTAILKQMGSLSAEERPVMGQLVNEAKQKTEELINEKKSEIKEKATQLKLKAETIDITMPGKAVKTGGLHPLNTVLDDMIDIFQLALDKLEAQED